MDRLKVLIATPSHVLAKSLVAVFREAGHPTEVSQDSFSILKKFSQIRPDLLVLDLALPKPGGLALLAELERSGLKGYQVLLLGEPDELRDKAARYRQRLLSRNLPYQEMGRRLRGLLDGIDSRQDSYQQPVVQHGRLRLDRTVPSLSLEGERIELEGRELALLEVLFSRPGSFLSAQDLCDRVSNPEMACGEHEVNELVSSIRRKLRMWMPDDDLIETFQGQFRLRPAH